MSEKQPERVVETQGQGILESSAWLNGVSIRGQEKVLNQLRPLQVKEV